MKKQKCRNPECNRDVYFMKDENGKIQVLDAVAPVFHYNGEDEDGPRCHRLNGAFVSHFATCKSPDAFSRKKK